MHYIRARSLVIYIEGKPEPGQYTQYDPLSDSDQQVLMDILHRQNVRSLCARYQDDRPDDYPRFRYDPHGKTYSPLQIIKACACYDYQAGETLDYDQTDAHSVVDQIRHDAIGELPGYEEADWEINEATPVAVCRPRGGVSWGVGMTQAEMSLWTD